MARGASTDRSFERLYRRHVAEIYRYAHGLLRDPADAAEVTQTTFVNAYRAFARGARPSHPKNWLIGIAHDVCRRRLRQQPLPPELPPEDDGRARHGPEDIQRALGHLPFNQRAALVARELEGRSYGEIAEIMGMSIADVETLLFRARRALREELEGALTCAEAELALSRQADGVLPRGERGQLRSHLREWDDCAALARRQHAARGALKDVLGVPLPTSLASFFGAGR